MHFNFAVTESRNDRIAEGQGKSSIAPLFQSGPIIKKNRRKNEIMFIIQESIKLVLSQTGFTQFQGLFVTGEKPPREVPYLIPTAVRMEKKSFYMNNSSSN